MATLIFDITFLLLYYTLIILSSREIKIFLQIFYYILSPPSYGPWRHYVFGLSVHMCVHNMVEAFFDQLAVDY